MTVGYIHRFQALVFDMNGTFMFGGDRFGPEQDYFGTYRASGGDRLARDTVHTAVTATIDGLGAVYGDLAAEKLFPSLREAVCRYAGVVGEDAVAIENIIATHECGRIPEWSAAVLRTLSTTHRLAVVSDLWALPEHWNSEFDRAGMDGVFETRVFSSSIGRIKPSLIPFRCALDAMELPAERTLFVGDSLERDIRPAKALGMGTVWVSGNGSDSAADRRVASITELLDLM
jgi:putative hydrolase of the HAD superfamily